MAAGVFVVDTAANTMTYRIVVAGLTSGETIAAIHASPPGLEDPNAVQLIDLGPVKIGTWNYPQSREADILAGNIYIDIHSDDFPGGEIRGQVQTHAAELDALQTVPPSASAASGWGTFMIDTSANTLRYYVVTTGIAGETSAHIRGPATHGEVGPVLYTLPSGSIKSGVWNYSQFRERDLLRGLAYINITTAAFPDGAIRGQITNSLVAFDGLQEVPAVASAGVGIGFVSLREESDLLSFDIRRSELNAAETRADIHGFSPPGANSPVVAGLPVGVRKLGTWAYSPVNETNILAGFAYFNIRSAAHANGEIRGQFQFPPAPCRADVNGDEAVSSQDFFDFLTALFANEADINGDGNTNSQDFFDFLGVFFVPC